MRKTSALLVSLALFALPAFAQDAGGNVAMIHCLEVQPGTETRFEEGFKRHLDWHRKQKDTWTWVSWMAATGPETGSVCAGTFGHKWEDFDKPVVSAQADRADALLNFGAFVRKHEATFWTALPDVSRPAPQPTPMSAVIFFQARFGMDEEATSLIGDFHQAIGKAGVPWKYTWYALASGGEGGTYALVLPRADFAAFNPSGKTFNQVLEEVYGKTAARGLLTRWSEVMKSSRNHLVQARPDLGYTPTP